MTYSVTDREVLQEVQGLLAEAENSGASWSSGMWTPAEVLGYLDDRQQGVIADTGLVVKRATLPCSPGVHRQDLPADWIATLRLAWVRTSDTRVFVLSQADGWELDSALASWRNNPGIPQAYSDADTQTLAVQLAPAPAAPGILRIAYLALPTSCDGSGIPLSVPDECAPGLVWGVIARMLRKEGRAKDPARADFADQHYQMTLAAVQLLLGGFG